MSFVACGGSDGPSSGNLSPYTSEPDKTVVIGDGKGGTAYVTPGGADCIHLDSGECVKPQDKCKEGQRADVIVDSKGKVLTVVCYPASSTPTPVDSQGNVDLGKDNKGVVSVGGADGGGGIAGDVSSSGNNVTIYGQGPAVSVIGGSVDADGNNFAMRGVTVKQNVTIVGNNATLVLCAIDGDLHIEGNNSVVAECAVGGSLTIRGNNSTLVGNHVAKTIDVAGQNTACDGNTAWSDANANHLFDPGEAGAPIDCTAKK
ncbi:hypothetical protein AKJ09_01084 [Labilithrix luteola]|uniref:Uncharacterized protein n=1 Tax=Labilithrix luteola TaxID=1391654 RepID=A0A0K1PLL9_9BACT|nr:hypothetical protein [Labilithrix luteola]AKU94420.1 hypothetical protein AKJ09_01084 [Labilithrix luteola]